MKKFCGIFLSIIFLLSACAPSTQPTPRETEVSLPEASVSVLPSESESSSPLAVTPVSQRSSKVLNEEETIRAYFDLLYTAYVNMENVDMSHILAMDEEIPQNIVIWSNMLNQRRRLISNQGYCHVEKSRNPYEIQFLLSSGDSREEMWKAWDSSLVGESMFHFTIISEEGRVYPPFMAVNTNHMIRMKNVNGVWKITSHYFPGSVRKFFEVSGMRMQPDSVVLASLKQEFANVPQTLQEPPAGRLTYNGNWAAEYARRYTEKANPGFYRIEDWIGNCANFTSQCLWAGFGGANGTKPMTKTWYSGSGGGSPAWENVTSFWSDITGSGAMQGQVINSLPAVKPGDLLQVRPLYTTRAKRFSHSFILINEQTLLLGQNSPGSFVYYSDLVNMETRWIRPTVIV